MLVVCSWIWGDKYTKDDVMKLCAGVTRHLKQPHTIIVVKPAPRTDPRLLSGCFVRLQMFDPSWQQHHNIKHGDRLVCLDLDAVVTGPLDPLFDRPEDFVILGGANAANPCPYNGSVMMLRAGTNAHAWNEFDLDKELSWKKGDTWRPNYYEFPDDQGYLATVLPNAATWQAGKASGIYAFQKPGWPADDGLPSDARLVVFPGWRSPKKFEHLPWVKEHWRT